MAVLFITHKFPPSIGGMQKQSYELINGVRQFEKVYTIIQSPTESKLFFLLRLKSKVKKMLLAHPDISVVHCNDGLVASFCSWMIKLKKIKITATFHGLDLVFPNQLFQNIIVPKFRSFDRIYAVSEATALECILRGIDPQKIKVIKNGIDVEIEKIPTDPNFVQKAKTKYGVDLQTSDILISVGRAVKRKGFSWFAKEVMPHLEDNCKYLIIGPKAGKNSIFKQLYRFFPNGIINQIALALGYPTDSLELNQAIKESNGRILHLGKIPFKDLINFLRHADMMLMPNVKVEGDMEGFGLVALESALSGTYVLGSDIEGITCAIEENKNGKLIASEDAQAWIMNIVNFLKDKNHLAKKSLAAKTFVCKSYSWEKMAKEYYNDLNQLSNEEIKEPIELNTEWDFGPAQLSL